ncbi:sugar-binding transcriptional regulator [Corynebacterium kroppenstedtii]|uniref:sugar-binding transcriptional regulator n=1 Tax=Corynebacterium sp. PCR 32 TaxID=3351342 RepID=UPI0030957317
MDTRDEQSLRAAKLYYRDNLSQADVAVALGVSRPTASKLIQHAHDRGFVTITIRDPREASSTTATALAAKYGLTSVHLAQPVSHTDDDIVDALGHVGARALRSLVVDGSCVGVSWGQTMYAIARHLTEKSVRDVAIVQLKGGMSYTDRKTNDIETIRLFCQAFHAYAHTLPLPVIFDNADTKELVEQDRFIAHVLEQGRHTDIVVFTVGSAEDNSLALNLGSVTPGERQQLRERAVGDICSRFFDDSASVAVPSVDKRTVGITLDDLSHRPIRLLVAGGLKKVPALRVALNAHMATHLVTDQACAERLLDN